MSSESYRKWYEKNKEHARKTKRDNMRRYREDNPEKYREQSRRAKRKIREKIFVVYGKQCVRCGFEDIRALTLDHILNNGAIERKELGERGVYRRAVEKHRPEEYQILCMNCQFIKQNQWLQQHGKY